MPAVLYAGLLLALPGGNVVTLLGRDGGEWVCQYAPGARARGEVNFSHDWLLRYGRLL